MATKHADIKNALKSVGINSIVATLSDYDESPSEEGSLVPFVIGLDRDRTKLELNIMKDVDVNVILSKNPEVKQAVINVAEKAHKVNGYVIVREWGEPTLTQKRILEEAIDQANGEMRLRASNLEDVTLETHDAFITLPEDTTYTGEFVKTDTRKRAVLGAFTGPQPEDVYHIVKIVADVPESEHSFLVGKDDLEPDTKHLFISMLPSVAKSVEHAHKILRPAAVTSAAVRAAEFFFEPIDADLCAELDHMLAEVMTGRRTAFKGWDGLEAAADGGYCLNPGYGDNHYVDYGFAKRSASREPEVYVLGLVSDAENRHLPVWLPEWRRVYRSNEIESRNGANFD